jgi:hypothetical protein
VEVVAAVRRRREGRRRRGRVGGSDKIETCAIMLHHEELLALQGVHFEEGKVLVRQRWAGWRSRSFAVCVPFVLHWAL